MSGNEAIVLVGGLGTRLRPMVADVPKALAPVAGRPFLAWLLERLERNGIRRAILATGYLSEQIEAEFGTSWNGLHIDYSVESEPLGTGGAIALALRKLEGNDAHVLNGDTFLDYRPYRLAEAVNKSGYSVGIALASVPDVARYGAVAVEDGRVVKFLEKGDHGPGLINAGCYYLGPRAIAEFPSEGAFSFERSVLMDSVAAGEAYAFTDTDAFIDIGVPDDYLRAQSFVAELG